MDINAASMAVSAAAYSTGSESLSSEGGGGVGVKVLKEAINTQSDMAMRLINANLELSFQQEKMDIAAQIIAQNQVDVYV